MFELGKISVL